MTNEGAWYLLRAFVLSPLVHTHVYGACDHFTVLHDAGIATPWTFPLTCPKCQRVLENQWQADAPRHAEDDGMAFRAIRKVCSDRVLSFTLTYEDHDSCRVRLFDRATGALAAPELKGPHASLLLCAAAVWEHLPEEERAHHLDPRAGVQAISRAGRKFLYAVEYRTWREGNIEEQTTTFFSPHLDACLDFMTRHKDYRISSEDVSWWALLLEEVEADWSCPEDQEVYWLYSRDVELMNYQPLGGYRDVGPVDFDYPPPRPPPKRAGGW